MDDIRKKRDLKNERKRVQDENVQRKQQEKEAKEQVKEDKKKIRFAAAAGGESDEDVKIVPQKKQEKVEEYGDVDFDESKDARAMPK